VSGDDVPMNAGAGPVEEPDRLRWQLAVQGAGQTRKPGLPWQETGDVGGALRSELRETAAQVADRKIDRTVPSELLRQAGNDLEKR
jgi:hypothetical protein